MSMKNPPHPGLSVRCDCLEPLGLSVAEAAQKLGVDDKELSDIVNGRAGISPEMAIRLDKPSAVARSHGIACRRPTILPKRCRRPTRFALSASSSLHHPTD